jgi:2-polyprenyl-3-methyl-5-hydroxy-6-metoxy-1,4-benzoquinol methylase
MNCPICNEINSCEISIKNYYNYDLFKCTNCKAEFCHPFKCPSLDFYTNATDVASIYRHTKINMWPNQHPINNSKNVIDGKTKSILDIGCGNGMFAEFANTHGFNYVGIDIDKSSLEIARKRNLKNCTFIETTLEDFIKSNPNQKFDIVSMFEVFEHIDNPIETLNKIENILNPNGLFLGSIPNEKRFFAKKLNLNFALPPYHLNYWTKETWSYFIPKFSDLKIEVVESNLYYGYISNLLFAKTSKKMKLYKIPILNKFVNIFFRIIGLPEILIEKLLNKSSSLYFELRK